MIAPTLPAPDVETSRPATPHDARVPGADRGPITHDPVLLTVRRRFTVDDYHRMAEVGLIEPGARTELLDGEVVFKMTINSPHAGCVKRLNGLLLRLLQGRVIIGVQDPVRLDDWSEPEPDLSILKLRDDFYSRAHPLPADVLWLIEVADTTLRLDRYIKLPLYAAAGIAEVWLVDLNAATVEVHRDPDAAGYRLQQRFGRGDELRPAAFPDIVVAVDDVLGPVDDAAPTDA
ncbi:MAG: Uma2 family endonuclease [Ardenticatenales bacterium]|nr:Uma2 family endonuclease [Ardenticatenales bacterium]